MENFLQALTEDEKIREEFLQQTTPEGAYRVAKPFLEDMTMDEFVSELRGLARFMDLESSEEISDERLHMVTGGISFVEVMKTLNEHI